VRDGDVLEGNVELGGATRQVAADALGDGLALGDELGGVELGDDGLEDFVADGGEDSFVIVCAEILRVPLAHRGTSKLLIMKIQETKGIPGKSLAGP
jgi:hypothetical protein